MFLVVMTFWSTLRKGEREGEEEGEEEEKIS